MFRFGEKGDKKIISNMNPIVLAFVGDAVYSLFIREKLVFGSDCKTGELNKLATGYVKATAQAEFIKDIMPLLTEEELAVFKRGRNAKKPSKSKNATIAEYNMSTGFEAVLGYLYMCGDYERLNIILNKGKE